jgi:hypothetical protein
LAPPDGDGRCGAMDNELPTFKRIDINCEGSVEFL